MLPLYVYNPWFSGKVGTECIDLSWSVVKLFMRVVSSTISSVNNCEENEVEIVQNNGINWIEFINNP
jgi:hypothetical protein